MSDLDRSTSWSPEEEEEEEEERGGERRGQTQTQIDWREEFYGKEETRYGEICQIS